MPLRLLRSRLESVNCVGFGFERIALRPQWAAVPDKQTIVVAKSSAPRLDSLRPGYSATWIDADSCATQVRDD